MVSGDRLLHGWGRYEIGLYFHKEFSSIGQQ